MLLNTVAVAIVALGPVAFASPAPGVTDIDWSLLGGDTLSPLSGANPFKRQLYCTISTHVPCPNIDRCSPPGYTCCPSESVVASFSSHHRWSVHVQAPVSIDPHSPLTV
jgi:hypothetical protein